MTEKDSNDLDAALADARAARREGRLQAASETFQRIERQSRESGERRYRLAGLKGLAQIERDRDCLASSIALYGDAVDLARELGNPLAIAHTIRHLADVQRESGQLAEAGANYREALEIYRSSPDTAPLDLANALRSSALLTEQLGSPGTAGAFWEEARTCYRRAGVDAGVEECTRAIARCR